MPARTATAHWEGSLSEGSGTMRLGSGAFEGAYSFKSRFADGAGTNPEELLGAAHAGCFSMALSNILAQAGLPPTSIDTTAHVRLEQVEGAPAITRVDLSTVGVVPGIDAAAFAQYADTAKRNCPVSKLFAGTEITIEARLAE